MVFCFHTSVNVWDTTVEHPVSSCTLVSLLYLIQVKAAVACPVLHPPLLPAPRVPPLPSGLAFRRQAARSSQVFVLMLYNFTTLD